MCDDDDSIFSVQSLRVFASFGLGYGAGVGFLCTGEWPEGL